MSGDEPEPVPRLVARGEMHGEKLEPLRGRGWLALPMFLLCHLPLAALDVVVRGRLKRMRLRLLLRELRVTVGYTPHGPRADT